MRSEEEIIKFKRLLATTLTEYPQGDRHNSELLQIQIKTLEWVLQEAKCQ